MKHSGIYAAAALAALLSGCAGAGTAVAPTSSVPMGAAGSQSQSLSAAASTSASVPQYHAIALNSLGGVVAAGISDNEQNFVSGFSLLSDNATVHAALWVAGSTTAKDLSTLGGTNSAVEWPNHHSGHVAGISQTATTDPLGEHWSCSAFIPYTGQECHGFVWANGSMRDLGTLGGNNSFASGANQSGQVVGWAETAVRDATCKSPQVLQFEAVEWDGLRPPIALRPLNGDPDSAATAINDLGNAVGISGICDVAVGRLSAEHMILWHNGIPHKLATLGGSAFNTPEMINDENTVVGFSDLPGDKGGNNFNGHAFRWTQSIGTVDLGTLSGDTISFAYSVNDSGQIVGQSCNTNQCSVSRAFLYQNGTMYDLNGLLDSASAGFNLIFANDINDEGQITGLAVDPSGAIVGFRLNPDGTTPARSGEAVTMRSGKALNYHVHMGLFGRPIVTR